MATTAQKFKRVCQIIHDRVALMANERVTIFIEDFTDEDFSVGDVVAALVRLVNRAAIRIIEIDQKANTEGGFSLSEFNLKLLTSHLQSHGPTYDLKHLDKNKLSKNDALTLSVEPNFIDACSEQEGSNFLEPVVRKIILEQNDVQEIERDVNKNPIPWYCPICRSLVGTLGKKEGVVELLEKFARGDFIFCHERRHPNRFWVENGKIRFGTTPVPMEKIKKDDPKAKTLTEDSIGVK